MLISLQPILHYGFHILLPLFAVMLLYKNAPAKYYLFVSLNMLVDLDHLFSVPVFDPERCSIGSHLLHSPLAISIYFIMLIFPATRIFALGLCIHMTIDLLDCFFMQY